jgi:hypothetical protein
MLLYRKNLSKPISNIKLKKTPNEAKITKNKKMKERKFQQPNKTNNSNIIQRLKGHEKNQNFFVLRFWEMMDLEREPVI